MGTHALGISLFLQKPCCCPMASAFRMLHDLKHRPPRAEPRAQTPSCLQSRQSSLCSKSTKVRAVTAAAVQAQPREGLRHAQSRVTLCGCCCLRPELAIGLK